MADIYLYLLWFKNQQTSLGGHNLVWFGFVSNRYDCEARRPTFRALKGSPALRRLCNRSSTWPGWAVQNNQQGRTTNNQWTLIIEFHRSDIGVCVAENAAHPPDSNLLQEVMNDSDLLQLAVKHQKLYSYSYIPTKLLVLWNDQWEIQHIFSQAWKFIDPNSGWFPYRAYIYHYFHDAGRWGRYHVPTWLSN